MFTGLIEGVGRLASREMRGGDARLRIDIGTLAVGQGARTCAWVKAFPSTARA